MSGTKSHFQKVPATDAIIVAHGQPSDPDPAERALAALTERVQAHLPELRLGSATLAKPDALENAVENLPPDGLIYPMFMVNGWFTRIALPKRLGNSRCQVLDPLGVDPKLPALAADLVDAEMAMHGWKASQTTILLAAHGSGQGKSAAECTYDFAGRLARKRSFAGVATGFVEQKPFLSQLAAQMRGKTVCLPFFAMEGDHMRTDVREGIAEAGFEGPVMPALGQCKGVPALIAAALRDKAAEREAA